MAADLDPNWFTLQGFGALVQRWGQDVPVTLSAPVRRIRWGGPGVTLDSDRGTLRARAVADRIWFAGEALAPQGLTQTAAGARLSGETVAAEVAAVLAA